MILEAASGLPGAESGLTVPFSSGGLVALDGEVGLIARNVGGVGLIVVWI